MADKFHRFVDPTYFTGGGEFPVESGTTYDLVNVTSGGTGAGGSAFADAAKVGGPNVGTYFAAFGEDATSANFNRGVRAVAENTDHLDNLFHRDLALPSAATGIAVGAANVVLPVGTYLGPGGLSNTPSGLASIFSLLDNNGQEIFSGATHLVVDHLTGNAGDLALIAGAGGFAANAITAVFTAVIPGSVASAQVRYGAHANLATIPSDTLLRDKIRGTGVHIAAIDVDYAGGPAWGGVTNPATTVEDQLDKIITDLGTTSNALSTEGIFRIGGSTNGLFAHMTGTTLAGMLENIEGTVPWKDTDSIWTGREILGASSGRRGSINQMKALATPSNGTVFQVDDGTGTQLYGRFIFRSTSVRAPDFVFVHAPNVGSGNWEHEIFSILNAATGIAAIGQISGSSGAIVGRILPGIVPWGVTSTPQVRDASSIGWGLNQTNSTSNVAALGNTFGTVANVNTGDIIYVTLIGVASCAADFHVECFISENGGGDILVTPDGASAPPYAGDGKRHAVAVSFTRVVVTPGTFEVKPKMRTTNGANQLSVFWSSGSVLPTRP
jgi:hypothetical protein